MASYAFDLVGRDGSIETVEVGAYETDLDALRHAGQTLDLSLTAFAVNVWSEGVRVARVRRDVPAPRPLARRPVAV